MKPFRQKSYSMAGVGNPRLFHPSTVAPCSVGVQYAGEVSPRLLIKPKTCRGFQGPMWINFDLNEKRKDSHVVLDTFYSYPKRCEHHGALNTLMRCMFHSYSKPEGALAQKVQNGFMWEVILTFDVPVNPLYGQRHAAIAKLNNKHKP